MKMKKGRRNKKGFTMIELMIVITVIGILAIVLLPRIAGVRDEARSSGVEANMRSVQGAFELEIARATTASSLASDVAFRLNQSGNVLTNPVTGQTGAALAHAGLPKGVHIMTTDTFTETTSGLDVAGLVGVNVKLINNRLTAEIFGYDYAGKYIKDSKVTVKR